MNKSAHCVLTLVYLPVEVVDSSLEMRENHEVLIPRILGDLSHTANEHTRSTGIRCHGIFHLNFAPVKTQEGTVSRPSKLIRKARRYSWSPCIHESRTPTFTPIAVSSFSTFSNSSILPTSVKPFSVPVTSNTLIFEGCSLDADLNCCFSRQSTIVMTYSSRRLRNSKP